jgi:hypothetical protein
MLLRRRSRKGADDDALDPAAWRALSELVTLAANGDRDRYLRRLLSASRTLAPDTSLRWLVFYCGYLLRMAVVGRIGSDGDEASVANLAAELYPDFSQLIPAVPLAVVEGLIRGASHAPNNEPVEAGEMAACGCAILGLMWRGAFAGSAAV